MADPRSDDLWDESVSQHRARQGEQIASVALEIISEDGMSALTMSAIADRAGISRQTLYRYFADVGAVLTAAMSWVAGPEGHLAELVSTGTPSEQLESFVRLVLQGAAAGHPSPTQYESSLPPQAREAARLHAAHVEGLVVGIIERGVADGSFSEDLVPALDGPIIHRLVMASHDLAADAANPDTVIAHVVRRLRGLTAPGL